MLLAGTSPITAMPTPPWSAKLCITWVRSRRSSSSLMLLTGTNAIAALATSRTPGARVRNAVAHSTGVPGPRRAEQLGVGRQRATPDVLDGDHCLSAR